MSGASEIASYDSVLLAGEKPELLPPNLPFLQSLHVGMAKELFVDGLQPLPDLINQSLSIDHGNLSLDHFICPIQHRLWNRQTDLLRRLKIDDQLELPRPLHRQVSGLGTLEDPVYEVCGAPVHVRVAWPIGHQAARLDQLHVSMHPW